MAAISNFGTSGSRLVGLGAMASDQPPSPLPFFFAGFGGTSMAPPLICCFGFGSSTNGTLSLSCGFSGSALPSNQFLSPGSLSGLRATGGRGGGGGSPSAGLGRLSTRSTIPLKKKRRL